MSDETKTADPDRLLGLMSAWYSAWQRGDDVPVEALCPDAPEELRAELRDHIAAVKRLAQQPTATGDGPPAGPDQPVPTEFGGRYRAFYELARGGMGAVYAAHDTRLGRAVAAKVVLAGHPNPAAVRRRFDEEARITGRLQHPGVPPVHDLGELPDGRPYLVMKLIKGRTLADELKARPDPRHELPRFIQVFEQVAQTVAYAHAKGVIHRDLKPSNVMVGTFGEVQVMDWGLAKVLMRSRDAQRSAADEATAGSVLESDREADAHTRAGSVMGTLAYMPPEQAKGDVDQVARPADVFALGAILCEVLTGSAPYTGSASEVRAKATLGQVTEALDRLAGCGADAELVGLARACLSADAGARPADAAAVAAAVAAHRAGVEGRLRAAEVERAAAEARAVEQRKRRRVQVGLVAAVALFVAAVGGGLWQVDRERRQRESETGQLIQQNRFERLQLVTSAVVRLEAIRDQAREQPEHARSVEAARLNLATWERAAFALDQSAAILADAQAADPAVAPRIETLRRDIPGGVAAAKVAVQRTQERVESLRSARKAADKGDASAAATWAEKAVEADPTSSAAHLLCGDYWCQAGKFDAARASYAAGLAVARRHAPKLVADLEVRVDRAAAYATSPWPRFPRDPRPLPADAAALCDVAEYYLVGQHYDTAAALYERAFAADPRAYPAHRALAALAAALGGCGSGKDSAPVTADRRKQLRELAARWVPELRPAEQAGQNPHDSIVKLAGFSAARYRCVRRAIPSSGRAHEWGDIDIVLSVGKESSSGTTVFADELAGAPYPGKTPRADAPSDPAERQAVQEFLAEIVPKLVAVDLACGVYQDDHLDKFRGVAWALT